MRSQVHPYMNGILKIRFKTIPLIKKTLKSLESPVKLNPNKNKQLFTSRERKFCNRFLGFKILEIPVL